ncbi:hypothetical protein CC86DRAFT_406743 [Ophiobolus disseminans]|uniref:Uncharacterized protein n=1 Tax=Ophiobolus disseminans TaxID=1469910 RepID=A0A6A7A142_9PLEO|nr:hypothetical protein CC86DRAFT_406743 [Ophiobolus disseminans]
MRTTLVLFAAVAAVVAQDTVSATRSGVCEPHDDHWHCPSGVAQPTTPPPAVAVTLAPSSSIPAAASASASHHDDDEHDHSHAASATTCEPHGDHWHCPSGVAKPTTKPAASATTSRAPNGTVPAPSASASTFPGAAGKFGSGAALAVLGAVGAYFL